MKNIALKLTCTIFSVHLILAYIVGLSTPGFAYTPWFMCTMIPVIVIFGICFSRLDPIFQYSEHYSLKTKIVATTTNLWFWILLLFSSLLVVGIIYWAGQLLLPEANISQDFIFNDSAYQGVLLLIIVCSGLYFVSLIWIKKTLKNIWDA